MFQTIEYESKIMVYTVYQIVLRFWKKMKLKGENFYFNTDVDKKKVSLG
jgi:hypothetical protein